jgi:uncharacterized pyridoxamine 5'-phosphate oxidase family protein
MDSGEISRKVQQNFFVKKKVYFTTAQSMFVFQTLKKKKATFIKHF